MKYEKACHYVLRTGEIRSPLRGTCHRSLSPESDVGTADGRESGISLLHLRCEHLEKMPSLWPPRGRMIPPSFCFGFSSGCFRDFFRVFRLQNSGVTCLGKALFRFILLGVPSAPGTCRLLSLAEFGKLPAILSSRTPSALPFSCPSRMGTARAGLRPCWLPGSVRLPLLSLRAPGWPVFAAVFPHRSFLSPLHLAGGSTH